MPGAISHGILLLKHRDKMIATGGYDRQVKLWNPSTGQSLKAIKFSDGQINKLAFSPDGKFLAAAGYGSVRLYDHTAANPQPQGVVSFSEHKLNVTAIEFWADGRQLLTASEDTMVKLWDTREKKSSAGHKFEGAVNSAVLHPNQREVLVGSQLGELRSWDINSKAGCRDFALPDQEPSEIRAVAVSPDGSRFFAADNNGILSMWSWDGVHIAQTQAHTSYILRIAVSPDGRMLATMSADRTIHLWSLGSDRFERVSQLEGHQRWVWDGVFTSDSKALLTVSSDLSARMWDLESQQVMNTFVGHSKAVVCCAMTDHCHEML